MVSPERFRSAMGKFATGVAVISSREQDGAPHGMTANSLTSVSLEPPLVLVSIGRQRNTYRNVKTWNRFGVNLLARGQEEIARYYALAAQERSGDVHVPWLGGLERSPRIQGVIAYLDCRVVAQYDHGDHTLFIAQVEHAATGPGLPLVYYDRQLWGLAGITDAGSDS